ncbi:MAG: hypothetical protein ACO1OF_05290, partial [Adhaeribacter sp.]
MHRNKSFLLTLLYGVLLAGCTTSTVAPAAKQAKKQQTADAYFTNPIADGADPWVIKKDNFYYSCGSGRG